MAKDEVQRRLVAILAADIAGYSRLMGADEEGTYARLRSLRREVVLPAVAQAKGRLFKTTGDGFLVEFQSVVDAVRCAIQVQRQMAAREADRPPDLRLAFRIGVHLGDVMVEQGDLYGDGVNIAARLEQLAEPAGIVVSRPAREQARDRIPGLVFEDTGEHLVKNIARPVRAFRLKFDTAQLPEARRPPPVRATLAAASVLAALMVLGLLWWQPWTPRVEAASQARMVFPLPHQPSLAVLPFANLSGDPRHDFIGDGLAEDIIGALANLPELFVIARNSAFTYKNRSVKVQQVAEDLGVRYVIEGSVQRNDDRIRVAAQLIDALSGRQLWSERYDRLTADLFAVKDEITLNVVSAIGTRLGPGEWDRLRRRETSSLDAWLLVRQGFELNQRIERPEQARELFGRAIAIDPQFLSAYVGLANAYRIEAQLRAGGGSGNLDPWLDPAQAAVDKAMAIDPLHSETHAAQSMIFSVRRSYDDAVESALRAVSLGPNNFLTRAFACLVMFQANLYDAALENCKVALRLSPNFRPHWVVAFSGRTYLELGQLREAEAQYREIVATDPSPYWRANAHAMLAVILDRLGDDGGSRAEVAKAMEANPGLTVGFWRRGSPSRDPAVLERYAASWRRAGMPE